MQSFLIKLCIAILEKLLIRGSEAWYKFKALRDELEANEQKAEKYQSIVNKSANREERRKAEDELLD